MVLLALLWLYGYCVYGIGYSVLDSVRGFVFSWLYCTVLYCTVLYSTELYSTILHSLLLVRVDQQ